MGIKNYIKNVKGGVEIVKDEITKGIYNFVRRKGDTPASKKLREGLEKQGRRFTSDGYMVK